jgi:hypothetical protein
MIILAAQAQDLDVGRAVTLELITTEKVQISPRCTYDTLRRDLVYEECQRRTRLNTVKGPVSDPRRSRLALCKASSARTGSPESLG